MTRIAFVADTHADESKGWDEHCQVMQWIEADLAKRGAGLVIHCGDVFEGHSTPNERLFVAEWCQNVADLAPLVIVAGNHDKHRDVALLSHLYAANQILAVEEPCVLRVARVAVACLPWPRLSNLLAALGAVPHEESNAVALDALRSILVGFRTELVDYDGPRVLACHAMIDGSRTDSRQPMVGCDLAISVADLALAGARFTAAGHVHAEQSWEHNGAPIVYPGCPMHRTYGEPGPTSYVVADFDGPTLAGWERVPVPARPMLLIAAEYHPNGFVWIDPGDAAGADIRIRYSVDADQREAAKARAEEWRDELLVNGAAMVKLEAQVRATTRARAPEIAAARTLTDKLRAYWSAKGIVLGDREPRVLAKVEAVE